MGLVQRNNQALLIPPGCANAVLTLEDHTEYTSSYSAYYDPSMELGLRHNDPLLQINWPVPITSVSNKDMSWPDFKG